MRGLPTHQNAYEFDGIGAHGCEHLNKLDSVNTPLTYFNFRNECLRTIDASCQVALRQTRFLTISDE